MELLSSKFKRQIQTLLDKPNMILIATIPIKPVPFVDTIRRRKDCHLITVSFPDDQFLIDFVIILGNFV